MENKSSSTGITFCGALQIAFIVLKLTKIINWSWLWVLSPIWISTIFVVSAIIFVIWASK